MKVAGDLIRIIVLMKMEIIIKSSLARRGFDQAHFFHSTKTDRGLRKMAENRHFSKGKGGCLFL